ncbi:MAG: hypothetical protein WB441_07375 [Nocardioidaceae bacterium]
MLSVVTSGLAVVSLVLVLVLVLLVDSAEGSESEPPVQAPRLSASTATALAATILVIGPRLVEVGGQVLLLGDYLPHQVPRIGAGA